MISRTLKYTLATAILLAVMLVVTVVPVATAKTDTTAKPADGVAIERMIESLEPFVTRCDDGTFRLDIPKRAKIDKTSAEFRSVSAGMEAVNSLIQEGILFTTPDLSVHLATDDGQFTLQSNNRNEFKPRWYGFELWLSHSVCQYIETGVAIGEGAAIIAAVTGVGTPVALCIMAVIGVGGAILAIWDNGCGVHMKFYGFPPGPCSIFYIAAQTCK